MLTLHQALHSAKKMVQGYRRHLQAGLTLCVGMGLSIVTSAIVYQWEYKSIQAELQEQLDKIAIDIQRDINGNLEVLQAVVAFYSASHEISKQEFQEFVKSSLYRHPSLKAIAWLPRASNPEQLSENSTQTKDNFNSSTAQPFPTAQPQQDYLPIDHVVPLAGNEKILGFNLGANPTYQAALKRASKQEEIIITSRQQLLEQERDQPSVLVFLPIYTPLSKLTPTSTETLTAILQRREQVRGFAVAIFQINEAVRSALRSGKLETLNFLIQDFTAPEGERFLAFYEAKNKQVITDPTLLKSLNLGQEAYCPDGSACTRILNIENRRWLLRLLLTPESIAPQQHWRSLATLILGLILTSLVTLYLLILLRYTERIEKVAGERTAKSQQLEQTLQELRQMQAQLVQTEKMSSLGQLVAGVAHEINNPVNFIYGNLHHAHQYGQDLLQLIKIYQKHYPNPHPEIREYAEVIEFDFLSEDLPKLLSSIKMGADRIVKIVQSLRNFSRLDESDMKPVDIHEGIDSTLLILQSRLKAKPNQPAIEVIKNYGNLPLVECYAGQLNQVFMNIISNAIDALESYNLKQGEQESKENPGWIRIFTEYNPSGYITVRIVDNGPGMTEAVKKQLFDPFFTTKPVGKGTGLGLSISYQIVVEKHQGVLRCESAPGCGTEFWIQIPLRQDAKPAAQPISHKNPKEYLKLTPIVNRKPSFGKGKTQRI
ncbi:MAG: CHASE domain-containing protein [Actinomycetota bacterium]